MEVPGVPPEEPWPTGQSGGQNTRPQEWTEDPQGQHRIKDFLKEKGDLSGRGNETQMTPPSIPWRSLN